MGFKNIFPISASKSIIDRFYNKNKKFTRAENEFRIIMAGAIRSRRPIHMQAIRNESNPQQPIQHDNNNLRRGNCAPKLAIRVRRLTHDEIQLASNGNYSFLMKNKETPKTYNLRSSK